MDTKLASIAQLIDKRLTATFKRLLHKDNQGLFFPIPDLDISKEVIALTLRGGKRIRAALIVAGYELFKADAVKNEAVLEAACAIELLQSYLLIHDDIMDNDLVRRGAPSVHVSLGKKVNDDELGKHLAILAGDLASALHEYLLARLQCTPERKTKVQEIFSRMHMDVIFGQTLDLQNLASPKEIVQRKTASYTTIGPLCIGAALAGATEEQLRTVAKLGRPMGVAFQYRDDLIGVFGNTEITGKPAGGDIRNNKRTHLIEDTLNNVTENDLSTITLALGNAYATNTQIEDALTTIESSGAKKRCEQEIDALTEDVNAQLSALPFNETGKQFLKEISDLLAQRVS